MTHRNPPSSDGDQDPSLKQADSVALYQAAFAASEARLRRIIEQNADGMLVVCHEGVVRFANPAAAQLLGMSRDALLGAPLGVPLSRGDFAELDLHRAGEMGQVAEMRIVDIEWEGQPAFLISLRDVSDRKRAEAEQRFLARAGAVLARSLEIDRTLEAVADLAVSSLADWCAIDLLEEGGTIARTCLGREQAASGIGPHQYRGCALVAPEAERGLPQVLRSGRSAVHPKPGDSVLHSLSLRQPSLVLVVPSCRSLMIVPLIANGRTLGALSLLTQDRGFQPTDLTLAEDLGHRAAVALENARLFRKVQQAEEQLHLALASSRTAVWDWDLRRDHIRCSPNARDLWGFDCGPLSDFLTQIHVDDRDAIVKARSRAIDGEVRFQVDYRILQADGRPRWLSSSGQTYFNQDGEAERIIGVTVDVTDRRRLEEELRHRVEELAVADRRKNDWLAMLAHELRNPLFPIRNALHVLGLRADDAAMVNWARDTAERQVQHLTRLIDDLLDVSRVTRGKVQIRRESIDLAQVLRQTAQDHARALEEAGIRLEVAIPDDPVWVRGDATRLAQVIGNLLTNAGKFTDGGHAVHVELAIAPDGRRTVVTIRDEGIGIAPELLPRVFDAFMQADQSLERSRGGLGLGLALVKGLIELHGGSVRAESPGIGGGSTFTLYLPLEGQPMLSGGEPAPEAPALVPPLHILVIEDNADGAESLRRLLELNGHRVQTAHTGSEGVELAQSTLPDVVISDLGLPGMDGYAVARALRTSAKTQEILLIALSGYASVEDRRNSRAAGFDEHLAKPVNFEDLDRILAAVRKSR